MNEIEKILKFLCGDPSDKNCQTQAKQMLAELFEQHKETNPLEIVRVINKEIDMQQKETGAEQSRQERIKALLVQVRKERVMTMAGAKHPLSFMAGGPGADEGGPQATNVITKEKTDSIRDKVLQALIDGVAEVEITPTLRIAQSLDPNWSFYRVTYSGGGSVPGFSRQGQVQAAETNELNEAIALAARAMGVQAVTAGKERRGQHPLSGMFMAHADGKSKVVAGPGR